MAKVVTRKLQAALIIAALCSAAPAFSHSVRAVLDATGNRAPFTGLVRVTCIRDANSNPAMLVARVRDNSESIHGLMVNVQLVKGAAALSISDEISGDAAYSDFIALSGGAGEYIMLIDKTAAGSRDFDLEWHCLAADGAHTETDTTLQQFK